MECISEKDSRIELLKCHGDNKFGKLITSIVWTTLGKINLYENKLNKTAKYVSNLNLKTN